MAVFQEDFLRCTECSNKEFVEKKVLIIDSYATKVVRAENEPLPSNLLEEKVIYVCSKCGHILDV